MPYKTLTKQSLTLSMLILLVALWLLPTDLTRAQEAENVELVGHIEGISPTVVSVTGNLAYVGVGPKMIIFDVSNPTKPVELGSFSTLKNIKGITLHGSLAYIAADTAGLRIVDISNPTNPVELSFFKPIFVGNANDVAINGNFAYLVNNISLRVVDISNPISPIETDAADTSGGQARGIAFSKGLVYVADFAAGLKVFDVTTPTNITRTGLIGPSPFVEARQVAVNNDIAYIADGKSGLRVVDVSDPKKLSLLSTFNTPGEAYDVEVHGNISYVADKSSLQIIDVTSPISPTQIGFFKTAATASAVAVQGNTLYVAANEAGLYILRYTGPNKSQTSRELFLDAGQNFGPANSQAIQLADFNGDGFLDQFIANGSPNQVWLNQGTGIFTQTNQQLGNGESRAVAIGDLDNDSDVDAVVGNADGDNEVWLNDGTGVFTQTNQTLGGGNSQAIVLGDLDGQNGLDVVIINNNQPNQVWLNQGTGIFTNSHTLGSGNGQTVALGDLDGQNGLDIIIGNGNDQANEVWLNNGSGVFTQTNQTLGNGNSQAIVLADLDEQNGLDMVVINDDNQANELWLNNGSGVFTQTNQTLSNGNSQAIALGDLDGQNGPDIIIGNDNFQANTVWLNNGSGVFTNTYQAVGMGNTQVISLADLNGDSFLDVFVGNDDNQPNEVWLNDGTGRFTATEQTIGLGNSGAIALGDLDNDGDVDIAIGNSGQGEASVNQIFQNLGAVRLPFGPNGGSYTSTIRGLTTRFTLKANVLAEGTTLTYQPHAKPGHEIGNLSYAGLGRGFSLTSNQTNPFKGKSIQIEMEYQTGSPELYYWDENSTTWLEASNTCPTPQVTHEDTRIMLSVCHLTDFALLSGGTRATYLPMILAGGE